MTYVAVVKQGHQGAGRYGEKTIYVDASNILDAMSIAKNRGSVKKGRSNNSGQSIVSIKELQN